MNSATESSTSVSPEIVKTARSLRTLYFLRTAFSVTWVILVSLFARSHAEVAAVLFIIYPAWDALATFLDLRANPPTASKVPQLVNASISIITTLAVALVLQHGVPSVMMVFGAWAILTGLIQLILGVRRRKKMGGQWPMILSGGQSMLAGGSFIATAHAPTAGLNTLAGYAAFGAFYFLLSAITLSKTIRANSPA